MILMRVKLLTILLLGTAFQANDIAAFSVTAYSLFYAAHKNKIRGAICFTAFAAASSYLYYNRAYFYGKEKNNKVNRFRETPRMATPITVAPVSLEVVKPIAVASIELDQEMAIEVSKPSCSTSKPKTSKKPKIDIQPSKVESAQIISNPSKAQFNAHMKGRNPVVVILSMKNCRPCNNLKAWIKKADFKEVTFLCVDQRNIVKVGLRKVRMFPTIMGYKNGKRRWFRQGYVPSHQADLRKRINGLKK